MSDNIYFIETGMFTFVEIGVCLDEASYQKYIDEQCCSVEVFDFLPNPNGACCNVIPTNNGGFCFLLAFSPVTLKKYSLNAVVGIITHECVHVMQKLKLIMAERENGIEFEAYLMQWLVQSVLDVIQREVLDKKKAKA